LSLICNYKFFILALLGHKPIKKHVKFKKTLLIPILFTWIIFLVGCSKSDTDPLEQNEKINSKEQAVAQTAFEKVSFDDTDFTIPIEAVQALALNITKIIPAAKFDSANKNEISLQKSFTLTDSTGKPNMYVFNYKGDGFAVFSADERYNPVLAFVPKGSYEKCKDLNGINLWFEETSEKIDLAKQFKFDSHSSAKIRWQTLAEDVRNNFSNFKKSSGKNSTLAIENNATTQSCTYPTYTDVHVGMTTTWGQGCGYNDLTPNLSCSPGFCNTNAPTGCVATAMAQVIRFWQASTPQNYTYTGMPDDNSYAGNTEVPRVMLDAANSVNMNWGCNGSGAYMNNVAPAFTNTFGYRNANYITYNTSYLSLIISNITNGYPVILGGCTSSNSCHAWVCSGYEKLVSSCYTYYYLYMNWGWGSYGGNGWFENNNWNSSNGTFSHHQKDLIYNILP
jgi:hypothetical protein